MGENCVTKGTGASSVPYKSVITVSLGPLIVPHCNTDLEGLLRHLYF